MYDIFLDYKTFVEKNYLFVAFSLYLRICFSKASIVRSTASSKESQVFEAKKSTFGIEILISASLFDAVSGFTTFKYTSMFNITTKNFSRFNALSLM